MSKALSGQTKRIPKLVLCASVIVCYVKVFYNPKIKYDGCDCIKVLGQAPPTDLDVLSIEQTDTYPTQEAEDVRGCGLLTQLLEQWT